MTAHDLVSFWSELGDANVHPQDRPFLNREHFETQLYPVPWAGSLKHANVFLCYLNPGYSPDDHAYERERDDFVTALKVNLLGEGPYFYLLEKFNDHPGHKWAKHKLGPDLTQEELHRICVLQIVPYHSRYGDKCSALVSKLPSSQAMLGFVQQSLVSRALNGDIALIVTRQIHRWGIPLDGKCPHILAYQGSERIGAFVTAKTKGGKLMRAHLRGEPHQ